jgi:excisionase family DNA binding protein
MRGRTPEEKRALHGNSPIMTVIQLADYLQIHVSTVYRMLKRGDFNSCTFRVGSDHRFIKSAVDAWIAARGVVEGPEAGRGGVG